MREGLLFLAPALILAIALLRRRYPGERLLKRLACARPKRRLRPASAAHASSAPRAWIPRGGLLLGFSLAVRPPPLAASCA
jgi:hypothetical protein